MGKGIKMCSAKDYHGHLHTVKELQELVDGGGIVPSLRCEICGCTVTFVKRHKRKNTEIHEHIRLVPESEHTDSCVYSVSGRLKLIAKDSDSNFLKEIKVGKRELRLLILHNTLIRRDLSCEEEMPKHTGSSKNTIEMKTSIQNKLNSYLRTTRDILELRAMCVDCTSLASELTLNWRNKKIFWKNFFFESNRFDEAWTIVKSNKQPYPIALVGKVREFIPLSDYKYLNCYSQYYEDDGLQKILAFNVSLKLNHTSFFDKLSPGTDIIMFGIWEAYVTNKIKNNKTYVNHNLVLKPRFKQQIITINSHLGRY